VVFTIKLFANATTAGVPGYHQWAEAFDHDGRWCGIRSREPAAGIVPEPFRAVVRVLSRDVYSASGTASEALRRFDEWQANGYPEAWLMNPEGS
jgi:hypothetical protein